MKSIVGACFQVCLFGESHSPQIGAVLNGLAPGIALDLDWMASRMKKRKAQGAIATQRHEPDDVRIVSGFYNGRTTGTPLCLLIDNCAQDSTAYPKGAALLRPSHADYTAQEKYCGFQDPRGGGHLSGRLTAPIVAAGAIALQVLRAHDIFIGTHILQIGNLRDSPFSDQPQSLLSQVRALDDSDFAVLDEGIGAAMRAHIARAASEGDSVGGILETAIVNMPCGVGEPFFDSIESTLSALLYSIPAVKGVEFGLGFGFASAAGSQVNDAFCMQSGRIATQTNHNGGINGGISNGSPILIKTAVKPTPSIFKPQQTVDWISRTNQPLRIAGRHDPAILHRARVVADSMAAIGLLDLFCQRYGYLWMTR